MEQRHSLIKLRVPVLGWQLHFPGGLRVPESSTCPDGFIIPVETGRPLSVRYSLIAIREALTGPSIASLVHRIIDSMVQWIIR